MRDPRLSNGPAASKSLTPREFEVAELVAQGYANADIAANLGISHETVKSHLVVAFRKLGVISRLDLAVTILKQKHKEKIADILCNYSVIDMQSH